MVELDTVEQLLNFLKPPLLGITLVKSGCVILTNPIEHFKATNYAPNKSTWTFSFQFNYKNVPTELQNHHADLVIPSKYHPKQYPRLNSEFCKTKLFATNMKLTCNYETTVVPTSIKITTSLSLDCDDDRNRDNVFEITHPLSFNLDDLNNKSLTAMILFA